MTAKDERTSFSHRAIFWGLGVTLALGFVAGIFILQTFATYEPQALARIPSDARFVARLNVQQAVVHKPMTEALLPLFEKGRMGPESRLMHLERKTTLELDVDVRELIYAELGASKWLIVAGGFLRSDEVVDGVGRMLEEEGIDFERTGESLVRPNGVTFCIGADGTLVLGSSREVAQAACGAPGPSPEWAFELSRPGVALAVRVSPGEKTSPASGAPSHLRGGTFVVQADSHFPTDAQLTLSGEDWTKEQVNQLLSSKSKDFNYLVPLDRLRMRAQVEGEFRAQGNLSREEFDSSVARLATRIGAALGAAGPEPAPSGK